MNISINDSTPEIGGLVFFLKNLADYLPYNMLSMLASIFGIFGNLLIIGTIIKCKDLQSSTYLLIFNMALADLVISTIVDPFQVVGVLVGKNFFTKNYILCDFVAAICLVACETSLISIGFLAFNRYIHICQNQLYNKIFTRKKTLIYCCITWMIGILIDIPNLVGWGGHYYDPKTLSCVWNREASLSYSLFFPLSSIVFPCICVAIFYIRIFLFVRKTSNKISSLSSTDHSRNKKKSIQVAKGLFLSYLIFTLCWLPYGMVVMCDFDDQLNRAVYMFTMAIAHCNSSMNPILYAIFNNSFKQGCAEFMRMLLFIKASKNESKTGFTYDKSIVI